MEQNQHVCHYLKDNGLLNNDEMAEWVAIILNNDEIKMWFLALHATRVSAGKCVYTACCCMQGERKSV